MLCHICAHPSLPFASAVILKKHSIQYFRCLSCGFIQTEEPFWLNEAYTSAITESDIGILGRNKLFSTVAKAIILACFDPHAQFLDYGGGYGLFVRMMRDAGLDFYWYDQFCQNLFAKGFEANVEGKQHYELVTAFEVFEHLVKPLDTIEHMLSFSPNILFSTLFIPSSAPRPGEWWYYCLDHGQHISLYTQASLAHIAQCYGRRVYSLGTSLHLLTEKRLPPFLFCIIARYKVADVVNRLLKRRLKQQSLQAADYFRLTGHYPH